MSLQFALKNLRALCGGKSRQKNITSAITSFHSSRRCTISNSFLKCRASFSSAARRERSDKMTVEELATHESGKRTLIDVLRSSFIPSIRNKNKRSEAARQDEVFLQAFNGSEMKSSMTSNIIAETFWNLINSGEHYPVIKAVRLIPHELCSNDILHAGIIAFARTNRPIKVKEHSLIRTFFSAIHLIKMKNRY